MARLLAHTSWKLKNLSQNFKRKTENAEIQDHRAHAQSAHGKVETRCPEAMYAQQRESYAKAEASWPKPKFRWVEGVKVYDSYEDYCND